jgi:5-methylcytosine-specific restriction enzyme B
MNLADRSLALVDLALRRRFAFLTLEPRIGAAWRKWCADRGGLSVDVIDQIEKGMNALNKEISDDKALGAQFRVGHSYVMPPDNPKTTDAAKWFRNVIETEIGPLLEEYWFDDPSKADAAKTRLLAWIAG